MKKIICLLLIAVFTLVGTFGCVPEEETSKEVSQQVSETEKIPASEVIFPAGELVFEHENVNSDKISAEGYYLYTSDYLGTVTPETDLERVDITVADGYVAAVSEGKSFLPDKNGFTVVCVGAEAVAFAKQLEPGSSCDTKNIEVDELSGYFAVVNDIVINIDILDGIRTPEGVCAIYTPSYGATTGTNVYGGEIVVSNGVVIKKTYGAGNCEIPADGYVISIHKDHPAYRSIRKINIGDPVELRPDGPAYSVVAMQYNSINGVRHENHVVIYRNSPTTGSNAYGYEVAVDSNGVTVGESYSGNMSIPDGGFVISVHGNSVKPLADCYVVGQQVKLDTENGRVLVINTPELCINLASDGIKTAIASFEQAKNAYLGIAYGEIDEGLKLLETELEQAKALIYGGDYISARDICLEIIEKAEILRYATLESRSAQNRAMWYRASEKNDDEVRKTVENLCALNVNALYLETFYDGYFIGYVDVDGVEHNPVHGNYDVLEAFVRIGHEYGIEVHAWVENFFAGYLNDDGSYTSPLLDKYKDKLLCDSQGNEFYYYHENASFVFLNPNDKDCRNTVLSVYGQMLEKYDVDGIHLDYTRFPELNYQKYDYGYNEDIISDFANATGITTHPTQLKNGSEEHNAWIDFRCEIINSFVEEVYALVVETDPTLWISCAAYPETANARKTIFQDVKTWVDNGWIDEVFSMTYSGDNDYVYKNAESFMEICKGKCFYSTGIAAFMDTSKLNFAYQPQQCNNAEADGVAVFALSNIMNGSYKTQLVFGAFRSPSVQVYSCGQTVKAQLEFVLALLNEADVLYAGVEKAELQTLKTQIETVISKADLIEGQGENSDYITQALADINELKTFAITAFGQEKGVESITDELDSLCYWLELTALRMQAKR